MEHLPWGGKFPVANELTMSHYVPVDGACRRPSQQGGFNAKILGTGSLLARLL